MTWINAALALLAVAGLTASALGWRHSLRQWSGDEPESWFALAKVLYAIAIGARILIWDVWWSILHHTDSTNAIALSQAFGWTDINIITSGIVLAGVYCSLRARHLLIPPQDRPRWPWWKAWLHPRWGLFR